MSRRKFVEIPDRAREYVVEACKRIRQAEVSSQRPANWDLELAIAWMHGYAEAQKEPKP